MSSVWWIEDMLTNKRIQLIALIVVCYSNFRVFFKIPPWLLVVTWDNSAMRMLNKIPQHKLVTKTSSNAQYKFSVGGNDSTVLMVYKLKANSNY